jgi:hypothetical protein
MSALVAWRTPFELEKFPSVWVTSEGHLDNVIVHVGLPAKWTIKFDHVVGIKICNESYDNNQRFWIDRNTEGLCSYTWEDSPWIRDFNAGHVEAVEGSVVLHYVLLGGDYNVEILAFGSVAIEAIVSSTT